MDYKYSFTSSQPLTPAQLKALNDVLQNLPGEDKEDFLDIPEWTSELELESELEDDEKIDNYNYDAYDGQSDEIA